MEFQFPSFPILLSFFFFVLILLKVVKGSKNNKSASKLPPGPWKLPFIGNMHQFVGSLPHHTLTDMAKKYGPLMHLTLGEVPTVVVSSAETAKEVMKTHDIIFASRPHILVSKIMCSDCTDIVFAPYGEYWRQLRKICASELLSTKRVQSFRSIRQEEVSNFMKWIASNTGSPINLSEKFFSTSYSITSRAAFGKKSKEQEEFISIINESVKVAGGFCIADMYPSIKLLHQISGMRPKLEKLHEQAHRILDNILNEHKRGKVTNNPDLVDVLLKVQEDDELEFPMTTENIKAVIMDIFSAGSDTSATAVDWTMIELLRNPNIMKKAQDEVRQVFRGKGDVDEAEFHELKYLKLVIKETLRLHPTAPLLLPRECSEKCEINGYHIPVKTKVIVNAWAIGRDPRYWNDAESYIPERFLDSSIDYKGNNFEYIPFGAGRRICPGMLFGLASLESQIAQLLYHFDWKLPGGMKREELDMTEAFGLTVRRKTDLYLIPIPYHQSTYAH